MHNDDAERDRLRTAALRNAESILRARHRAERELRAANEALERRTVELDEQRAWLEVTLRSIGDAVIATDMDCRITLLNPVAETLTGFTAAEAVGQPLDRVFRVVHEDTHTPLEHPIKDVLATQRPSGLVKQTALVHRDGSFKVIEDSAAPIRDPAGRILGAVMVFYDVTERRRAERGRRSREERLRAMFEQAAVGIAVAELDGRFVEVNQKFADILGYGLEEIRELSYPAITHPEDRALTEVRAQEVRSGQAMSYSLEKRYLRKDGTVVWSHTTVTGLRNARGEIEQMLGVIEDITERVEAQETMRHEARILELLNATGAAIASRLDLQTVLQTVTDAATQLSGAKFGAFFHNVVDEHGEAFLLYTLSGAPREAFDKFGVPRNTPVFEPTFRGEGVVRSADITEDPRYGRLAPHRGMPKGHLPVRSYLAVPVVSRKDEVIGGLFLGHPEPGIFTERAERLVVGVAAQASIAVDNARLFADAKAELERREQAEQALRDTDRRKDEFLATLAHELRNPLAPIRQAVLIARSETATEAQRAWSHDVIDRQVRHMALLLDDLLDISRVTRGVLPVRIQMTELAAVVEAAVETARPMIESKRQALSIELPSCPIQLAADPLRLGQVLSNLLTNAAKYTPHEGTIRVRAHAPDRELIISVIDTGIGLSAEAITEIFTMFSQVRTSQEHSEGGLGIGLALSKGIVELHGGTIEARSAGRGQGSEFIVRLPLRQVSAMAEPAGLAPDEPGAPRRVLVADDNRDAADSLAALLRLYGHNVTVVHDGEAAIEACLRLQPEFALLDIGMAGLDGYEVASRIRKSAVGKDVTLVAVTGWGQDDDKAQAFHAGFDHHFTKPVPVDALSLLLQGSSAAR